MTCKTAMVTDVLTVSQETTIGDALRKLIENKIRAMPVVDEHGAYIAMFDFHDVWKKLLPSYVNEKYAPEHLNFFGDSFDDVVEKADVIKSAKVSEVMDKEKPTVKENTAFWEAILQMHKCRGPLGVVGEDGKTLVGLLTSQNVIQDLEHRLF